LIYIKFNVIFYSMVRNLDLNLHTWMSKERRKPLLLRGARQTGKTYSVRQLSKKFQNYIEINFEKEPRFRRLFDKDYKVQRIIREISALQSITITPGKTLLFFDEIQACPQAVTALRYFFEDMPQLHVIGAGSLLEFELRNLSIPVGRIEFIYVRPFTFEEYCIATGREALKASILSATPEHPLDSLIHEEALESLHEYLFIGGMPGVIAAFIEGKSFLAAIEEQRTIIQTYRADFSKYTGRTGIERVEKVFDAIPFMTGEKTVLSRIDPDARAYQIKGALDLLIMARVVIKVQNTTGAGIPLTAGASEKYYKCIFLDVGLMQRILGVQFEDWQKPVHILDRHRGSIAEQFVGQELLHRMGAYEDSGLFYWHRTQRSSQAEVDYLCEANSKAVPVEVKSGTTGHLRSMHQYLLAYPAVSGGIKCSTEPFKQSGTIINVPLYAASRIPEFAGAIQ